MRESIAEADARFCADCCCTWTGSGCNKQDYSPHPGQCGMDVDYKIGVILRDQHQGKKWAIEYMAKLKAIKQAKT